MNEAVKMIPGHTGVGVFDGSLHAVTRNAAKGEWDEGWSTAHAADGSYLLLQVQDRTGQVVRISMNKRQAWELMLRLQNEVLDLREG